MSAAQPPESTSRRILLAIGVAVLLLILAAELVLSARQQSQTFDEAVHIFAGYRYWKNFDFGINPEHPPLVKLVATIPLLHAPLRSPEISDGDFKRIEYSYGRIFLYSNDARPILLRARLATALFTIALGISIFLIGKSLFGSGPAFLALIIFVFEPNFLAHGALVTTDVAASLGLLLGAGAYHFYLRKPCSVRLIASGLAAGLCLAVKLSGLLLFPMLVAISFFALPHSQRRDTSASNNGSRSAVLRRIASLLAISAIAWIFLWATYGFRFSARPSKLSMSPSLPEFSKTMQPAAAPFVLIASRFHLLPEAYLYGVADVFSPKLHPTSLFGTFYPSSRWFFFPAIFTIKSTAAFLLLLCAVPLGLRLWRNRNMDDLLFLFVPAAIYLGVAMSSGMNFGVRHLLPFYPFLIILIAAAAWHLAIRHRIGTAVISVLLLAHAASSLRNYPNYLPYANEFWGGSASTHKIMSDSNVDWGQGLIALRRYTDEHHVQNCWLAYFGDLVSDYSYYRIPCKRLPTAFGSLVHLQAPVIEPQLDGPVFLSASEVASTYWGSDWANPYLRFQNLPPSALVANSILVYNGRVDLHEAAALIHEDASVQLLNGKFFESALQEANIAIALAPEKPSSHTARANALAAVNRTMEANAEMDKAAILINKAGTGR